MMKHLPFKIHPCAASLLLLLTLATLAACNDDDGDTYADMYAKFGMLYTNSNAQMTAFTTDDDEYFLLSEPISVLSAVADTAYRAYIYYTLTDEQIATMHGFQSILVCTPLAEEDYNNASNDPVMGIQDIWLSTNSTYINLALTVGISSYVATSTSQQFYVVKTTDPTRGGVTILTLYHDLNGETEYYTTTMYLSIPIKGYFSSGEPVIFEAQTRSGTYSTTFTMPTLNFN